VSEVRERSADFFDFPGIRENCYRRKMSDHATMMYALPSILTLPTICPRSKTMYEMRSIHEDAYDGHHDADTDAKMPDDVITKQVIRLLQVSVSFPRAVSPR